MLVFLLHVIYLLTLTIAALIGWGIHKRVQEEFKPLVFFLFSEMLFELGYFLFSEGVPGLGPLLILLQAIIGTALLCWLSVQLNLFGKGRRFLYFIVALFGLAVLVGAFTDRSNLSRWCTISADTIKIVIGIAAIGRALVFETGTGYYRPVLFTGIGLVLFYTFSTMAELLVSLGNTNSEDYLARAYLVFVPAGIIANILFIRSVMLLGRKGERVNG